MSVKTKVWYAEQVLNGLQSQLRNRDEKIDPREVMLQLDNFVNEYAKKGWLDNWKLGYGPLMEEQFTTRFEWLTVTDPANNAPSTVTIPANYHNLPKGMGIMDVYFRNDPTAYTKKKYFDQIIIMKFSDIAAYRNNMAGNLEGRLGCYPKGQTLYFTKGNINATYGEIGMQLAIRDSRDISDTAHYPVPGDYENQLIQDTIEFFRDRRAQPADLIRDDVDGGQQR